MLAMPTVERRRTITQPGQLILLTDRTPSMDVPDPQMPAGDALLLARELGLADALPVDWSLADAGRMIVVGLRAGDDVQPARELLATLADDVSESFEARGFARVRRWNDVPGHQIELVADLLDTPADATRAVTQLRFDGAAGDRYARVVDGRLHPPTTGAYRFHLAGDATAELWLSTDDQPGNLRPVLTLSQKSPRGRFGDAVSTPIQLDEGASYAFQLRHKEGTGDDHLALAWNTGEDDSPPVVIADRELSPPANALSSPQTGRRGRQQVLAQLDQALAIEDEDERYAALATWPDRLTTLFDRYATTLEARSPEVAATLDVVRAMPRNKRVQSHAAAVANLGDDTEQVVRELTGETTDLASAIASMSTVDGRRQVAVLLSDGRHTSASPQPSAVTAAASALARQDIPLHTLLVGSPREPVDLSILGVTGPSSVHRDDRVSGRLVLGDTLPPGKRIKITAVTSREDDNSPELWSTQLDATGQGRRTVNFDFPVAQAAAAAARELEVADATTDNIDRRDVLLPITFVAETFNASDDPADELRRDNNTASLPVRVLLRGGGVLVIDGQPRWETRYVES
ncbi:MAG: hypothetical protein AAGK78_07285, partial [Planctomycetota bacterium]